MGATHSSSSRSASTVKLGFIVKVETTPNQPVLISEENMWGQGDRMIADGWGTALDSNLTVKTKEISWLIQLIGIIGANRKIKSLNVVLTKVGSVSRDIQKGKCDNSPCCVTRAFTPNRKNHLTHYGTTGFIYKQWTQMFGLLGRGWGGLRWNRG